MYSKYEKKRCLHCNRLLMKAFADDGRPITSETLKRNKYCSDDCRHEHNRVRTIPKEDLERKCKECGGVIYQERKKKGMPVYRKIMAIAVFCDSECKEKWRSKNKAKMPKKSCIQCGEDIATKRERAGKKISVPTIKKAKYCSEECRDAHLREKRVSLNNCDHCGAVIERKERESIKGYSRRRFCGLSCERAHAEGERISAEERERRARLTADVITVAGGWRTPVCGPIMRIQADYLYKRRPTYGAKVRKASPLLQKSTGA